MVLKKTKRQAQVLQAFGSLSARSKDLHALILLKLVKAFNVNFISFNYLLRRK
ncbi:hypothetical protein Mic7113_4037 [Allocoleopsis franciscana PCC 7113]|uniref:Uncharacterized protein n=1 Tax=Allocoleopsis franciscana PCC 7113 TaxID=1173027 RepID=K9WJN8_9CYAN|nr:hypothetical protein Mic7113_4037 [Allocoleopsis franciscana PCC 7113]